MTFPLAPPIPPMLARLRRDLPEGELLYEPKWDGFRCLSFVAPGDVDLRSRHGRPLARYFPEIVEAFAALPRAAVLDGELVIPRPGGLAFEPLLARLHPSASRVAALARDTPAALVAFDVLADGDEDLTGRPLSVRRARLGALLAHAPAPLRITPSTRDPGVALLLGLWDAGGRLVHVGVSSSFAAAERRTLFELLAPLAVPLAGHPWERGFNLGASPVGRLAGSAGRWDPASMSLDWTAIAPERVAEVAYDQLDALRLRHPARFVRWRPDRDPRSCELEQLVDAGVASAPSART